MDHFAGPDVETSVCIVDDTGKMFREAKVASEPEAVSVFQRPPRKSLASRLRRGRYKAIATTPIEEVFVGVLHVEASAIVANKEDLFTTDLV